MDSIYEKIKRRRIELGMTLQELADKVGYTNRSSIHLIENGKRDITQSQVEVFAKALNVTPAYLMGWEEKTKEFLNLEKIGAWKVIENIKIPLYGEIACGEPIFADDYIEDYVYIDEKTAKRGDIISLKAKGDSMLPLIHDGDIIIILRQSDADDNDIVAVNINGESATLKKIRYKNKGIEIFALNEEVFAPKFYSAKEIETLPIRIIGKVIEVRRKI